MQSNAASLRWGCRPFRPLDIFFASGRRPRNSMPLFSLEPDEGCSLVGPPPRQSMNCSSSSSSSNIIGQRLIGRYLYQPSIFTCCFCFRINARTSQLSQRSRDQNGALIWPEKGNVGIHAVLKRKCKTRCTATNAVEPRADAVEKVARSKVASKLSRLLCQKLSKKGKKVPRKKR